MDHPKMNLPNKLTLLRIVLVPFVMLFVMYPIVNDTWSRIFAAAIFFIAAVTDVADGIMARSRKMITDFGKFIDPIADKFMVIGTLIAITASYGNLRHITVWATAVVFFREFAVTSLRLLVNAGDSVVVPANIFGKIKTVTQCVCILTVILEPVVITKSAGTPDGLFSYITTAVMLVATVLSAITYFKAYRGYIDPTK